MNISNLPVAYILERDHPIRRISSVCNTSDPANRFPISQLGTPAKASSASTDSVSIQPDSILPDSTLLSQERLVFDRGFRYGQSLFETVAIWCGRPLFLEEHLQRLATQGKALNFHPPPEWQSTVRSLLLHLPGNAKASEFSPFLDCSNHSANSAASIARPEKTESLQGQEGVARIYMTAGDGSPNAPVLHSRVIVLFEPLKLPQQPQQFCDAKSILAGWLEDQPAPKSGNYWFNLQAQQKARQAGAAEAVLVKQTKQPNPTSPEEGLEAVSAAMANLFVVIAGQLYTPPLASGARDGVIRMWVKQHFCVQEASLWMKELPQWSSAFLTNSRIGIQPLTAVDHHPLSLSQQVQEVMQRYQDHLLRTQGFEDVA